jgi:hypothetical protein
MLPWARTPRPGDRPHRQEPRRARRPHRLLITIRSYAQHDGTRLACEGSEAAGPGAVSANAAGRSSSAAIPWAMVRSLARRTRAIAVAGPGCRVGCGTDARIGDCGRCLPPVLDEDPSRCHKSVRAVHQADVRRHRRLVEQRDSDLVTRTRAFVRQAKRPRRPPLGVMEPVRARGRDVGPR